MGSKTNRPMLCDASIQQGSRSRYCSRAGGDGGGTASVCRLCSRPPEAGAPPVLEQDLQAETGVSHEPRSWMANRCRRKMLWVMRLLSQH